MMVPVLDTFIDESSDQTRKDVFCVVGFLAHEQFLKSLEEKWMTRLHDDGVEYFSAKDCKSVQGPFKHLRKKHGSLKAARKVAESIRADLENILVPPLVACRSEFVTADTAGGVRVFPLDRPSIGGVSVDVASEFAS
jgi:hypothetical protein